MAGRARMTGWYDPPRLVSIALRVAVSTVFGEFADRREAVAAARAIDPAALDPACDYRGEAAAGAFWLDFVADTGDGWNSTYAIARLLAAPSLAVAGLGEALPPGRVLIMGGDQVYPTPSRDLYREKLVAPFDAAARQAGAGGGHLYAIPGNHDWYDGLSAFLGLFCARRAAAASSVGARRGRRAAISRWPCRTAGGCGASTCSLPAISTSPRSISSATSRANGWSRARG